MESDGQSVPTRQDDRKFESLLDEVLTTLEAEKPEIDASDETLKANEKLVHVIISAGVDSLHASPRIRTGDQRYARAVKSLKAVTVILSKNTQLLYKAHVALPGTTILPPEVNEASVNPFTRFLIAKLVSLISLDLPSEVIEPIAPLLETIYIIIDRGFVESPEVALDSIVTYLLDRNPVDVSIKQNQHFRFSYSRSNNDLVLGVLRLHGLLSDSWDRRTPSSCIKKYILSLPTLQTVWRNFEIGSGDAHSGGVIVEIQCRVLDSIRKSFRITECAGSRALHRARSTISVNTHGSIVSALIQDVVNTSSKLSIDSLPTALQAELYACLVTVIAAICVGYDGSTKESFSLSRQIRINPVPNSTSGSTQSRLVCLISMLQAIDPEAGEKQIWPQLRKQLLSDASVDQDSRIADILASSELAFLPTRYKSISSEPRSPASKRRRLLDPTAVPLVEKYTQLVNRLSVLLGLPHVGSIESIKDYYKSHPTALADEAVQITFLDLVCQLICEGSRTEEAACSTKPPGCRSCILSINASHARWQRSSADHGNLRSLISSLCKSIELRTFKKPRLLLMTALRRLLLHSKGDVPSTSQLGDTNIGHFCLQSLTSSLRELRLAAAYNLGCFIGFGVTSVRESENQELIFHHMLLLSKQRTAAADETIIFSLRSLAYRSHDSSFLNTLLLKLVEFFYSSNAYIHGLAFDAVQSIAVGRRCTPTELLEPYWRTISVTAVQNLASRPQSVQMLCEVLEMSVNQFLVQTQLFTLPYLVLGGRREIVSRIASAHGADCSTFSLCTLPSNQAAVLAILLLQPFDDYEKSIMALLSAINPGFKKAELAELIRGTPDLIAVELLRFAGFTGKEMHAKVDKAFDVLGSFFSKTSSSASSMAKRVGTVAAFFDMHILAILTSLSFTLGDVTTNNTASEKLMSVLAIAALVRVAHSAVGKALPQICGFLQTAIQNTDLRQQSLQVWAQMVVGLETEDLESVLEITLAVLMEHHQHLSVLTFDAVQNMARVLARDQKHMLEPMSLALPDLSNIPVLAPIWDEVKAARDGADPEDLLQQIRRRLANDNSVVVEQALQELIGFLRTHASSIQDAAISGQPEELADLDQLLLKMSMKWQVTNERIPLLACRCLGVLGCSDYNRVELPPPESSFLLLSNFEKAEETTNFVIHFIESVLVKIYLSSTNLKAQGLLAYALQELLKFCGFRKTFLARSGTYQGGDQAFQRWTNLPTILKDVLGPLLTSSYVVLEQPSYTDIPYPIYHSQLQYSAWLRLLVLKLLGSGARVSSNAELLFPVFTRIIRNQDLSIPVYLLPYLVLNLVIGGSDIECQSIMQEMQLILQTPVDHSSQASISVKQCSESVFNVLDYLSRWKLQKERSFITLAQGSRGQEIQMPDEADFKRPLQRIKFVQTDLPARLVAQRASDCASFPRALLFWEAHIRQLKHGVTSSEQKTTLMQQLQKIYAQIDEPDGIEGLSAHLHVLDMDQQLLEHRKAGRWTAAQNWYELELCVNPRDVDLQTNLLECLKQSGHQELLLDKFRVLYRPDEIPPSSLVPYVLEAAWETASWQTLHELLPRVMSTNETEFSTGLAKVMNAMFERDNEHVSHLLIECSKTLLEDLSHSSIQSLQGAHQLLLRLHVLEEVQIISRTPYAALDARSLIDLRTDLGRRLAMLGSSNRDKQYVLSIRRAVMALSGYAPDDLADVLLLSAKLYRKAGDHRQSFKATLQATAYGAPSATIEQARLLWAQQHQRKAIQTLESAIVVGAFSRRDSVTASEMMETDQQQQQQNILVAKAKLLLTKWLDSSGQLASVDLVERYREASSTFTRWEKGHYALGRYYNKLLEADKAAPLVKQSQPYHSGETVKLIIKAYLKALTFGVKYVSQTLPKLLTLWLDLGQQCHDSLPLDPKVYTIEYSNRVLGLKLVQLSEIHKAMQQALAGRVPAYVLYTAFPQMIARICHPTERVHELLESLIVRVVSSHPQQALWALMAVVKSSSRDRASRGTRILDRVRESDKGTKAVPGSIDIRSIVAQAKRLSEILLQASETDIPAKVSQVSLAHHLKVSFKSQRGIMVIPIEATLIPVLPTESENMRIHKAFSKDAVTIEGFKDEVTVLSSLQRPRKLTVRGSDGKAYGLLCKPKDDLRKDQRLMEFNTIINRALRKDAESSQRRLYIKTYAVTPLNEECGVIEWVDGLRTLRDILLSLYRAKGVQPNYQELRGILDEICATPAKNSLFQEKVLARFPPVLHEWFTTTFAEPSTWFTARLRYTRSAAVMSMIGHVLGLGDRHGENILFEEGNGGTFHVDFNCLFDKGLTFDKPERVPFRLTHNMVDAFGIYRHEGPFRKSCELTIKLLRANEDTLMTILETFVYDPTTDFIGKKKRRPDASVRGVVETPQDILDQVQTKVRGIMRGEVIPLGVEGQVQELIRQATDVTNLVNMYIGWCAFF